MFFFFLLLNFLHLSHVFWSFRPSTSSFIYFHQIIAFSITFRSAFRILLIYLILAISLLAFCRTICLFFLLCVFLLHLFVFIGCTNKLQYISVRLSKCFGCVCYVVIHINHKGSCTSCGRFYSSSFVSLFIWCLVVMSFCSMVNCCLFTV